MVWDFRTEPEFQQKLDWMRSFVDSELVPLEPLLPTISTLEWSPVESYLREQVRGQGLWGAFLPPELGGAGFGQLKLALMSEIIGRCMISMGVFGVQAPDSGNIDLLAHGANEVQKRRWLYPTLNGELRSAFALTEPFYAGADPTKIGTTAIRDGADWIINGHKWFITNASVADYLVVFAETNPDQRPHRHASIFILPTDTPGLKIVRDIPTMAHPDGHVGQVGAHAELTLDNCRVPHENLVGEPGQGFVLAQARLGGGRLHHAMRWLGQAQRSLEIMCERAVSRESHGARLADHQLIQGYIAESHTEVQAARLLTFHTAWQVDQYGFAAMRAETGAIKGHVYKVLNKVLDRTIQVLGALGYSADMPVEFWYRMSRFGSIGDGPDEVHTSVLARKVTSQFAPVEGWPTAHLPSRRPEAERKWAELRRKAAS